MPKLKTRKAASKRYKITGTNNFLRRHAFKGHLLMKKSNRQKRKLSQRLCVSVVRVKRGNVARKRRKKILSLASGYRGAHSVLFRVANQQVMKALRYSYIGRKQKKRIFRRIWISRINAASRLNGLSYSQLIHRLKKSNIDINRKMLSQIAVLDSSTFKSLVDATD